MPFAPALLAAALPLLAGGGLVPLLDHADSLVRNRAAHALARTHDPEDGQSRASLERILVGGPSEQRVQVIRGLTTRTWTGGMPETVERRLLKLLEDSDPSVRAAVVDGFRYLPPERAGDLLLAEEKRAEQRASATGMRDRIHRIGMEIGEERVRPLLAREVHRRTESLQWRRDCTLQACLEDLVVLAWLEEDVSFLTKRYRASGWHVEPGSQMVTYLDSLRLLRIRAAGGDAHAVSDLVREARVALDPEVRRMVFAWLAALPPVLRSDVVDAVMTAAGDPAPVVRRQGMAVLSAHAGRHRDFGRSLPVLMKGLEDRDPEVRLDAALALWALRVPRDRLERWAAAEDEPVVAAVLAAPLPVR